MLLFLPRLMLFSGFRLRDQKQAIEYQNGHHLGRTNTGAGETGPCGDVAVGERVRSKAIVAARNVQLLEPVPEVGQLQRLVGTVEVGLASACLTFDALKNLPRCCLAIGSYAAESEFVLSVVEEFSEGVVRKFPRSLAKLETCSRNHCTSV